MLTRRVYCDRLLLTPSPAPVHSPRRLSAAPCGGISSVPSLLHRGGEAGASPASPRPSPSQHGSSVFCRSISLAAGIAGADGDGVQAAVDDYVASNVTLQGRAEPAVPQPHDGAAELPAPPRSPRPLSGSSTPEPSSPISTAPGTPKLSPRIALDATDAALVPGAALAESGVKGAPHHVPKLQLQAQWEAKPSGHAEAAVSAAAPAGADKLAAAAAVAPQPPRRVSIPASPPLTPLPPTPTQPVQALTDESTAPPPAAEPRKLGAAGQRPASLPAAAASQATPSITPAPPLAKLAAPRPPKAPPAVTRAVTTVADSATGVDRAASPLPGFR